MHTHTNTTSTVLIVRVFVPDIADEDLLLTIPSLEIPACELHQAFARRQEQALDILLSNIALAFIISTTNHVSKDVLQARRNTAPT